MKHLKKHLMMTLALLITAATSAWAESKPIGLNVEYAAGDKITSTTDVYVYHDEGQVIKITSTTPASIRRIAGIEVSFNEGSEYEVIYQNPDDDPGGTTIAQFIKCVGESTGDATVVHVKSGSGTLADPYVFALGPFGTPVPLTRGTGEKINEWTLTNGMPAGNVTVNVKYFPQAEFAKSTDVALAPAPIPNVPANTDAPIVTPGTVANIGTSEVKQGTLMYFVSQPAGNTDPVAPTYDTEGWTDKVPTANGLKQGNVNVWYYIKGAEPALGTDRTDDNTRSDSDIKPLGTDGIVTLAAEPTYDVSLNKTGMAEGEPAKWSAKSTNVTTAVNLGEADLEGVKKGETVTVTYTGTKKVIGVKAEKKPAGPFDNVTSADLGKVIGANGYIYDDIAAATTANTTAVAMIAYVGSSTGDATYKHGLAIALADEGQMSWDTGKSTCQGKSAVRDAKWYLPSQDQWETMFNANGGNSSNYSGLNTKLASAGGDSSKLKDNVSYWTSSENNQMLAYYYVLSNGATSSDMTTKANSAFFVRACLAF